MERILSQENALRILVGFISGFIIGLERQKEIERGGSKQAGLRTFSLLSLTGTLAFLSNNAALAVTITISIGMFVAIYSYYRMFGLVEVGVTTPVAMLATYTLGALSGLGYLTESLAGAIIITLLLTTKYELRSFARSVSKEELLSVLQLALLLTVVYPLIPDISDPRTGVVNLRVAYFISRLLLTISFANYLMIRILGPKGVLTFGILGGLVSSEATTYTVYSELRGGRIAMATALISITALYLKLLIIVGLLGKEIIPLIRENVLLAILYLVSLGLFLAGRAYISLEKLPSPISYSSALKFTVTFIAISFFVALVETYAYKYYILAVILSSLVSVTAVTFSILALYSHGLLSIELAARYLLIGMAVGALNKIIYTSISGVDKKEIVKISLLLSIVALIVLF